MKTPEVVNYIEISGEDVEIDTLANEEIVKAGMMIQDNLMSAAGYQRTDDRMTLCISSR